MIEAMYLEMCSVIVMTLPCPMGELGPRKTATAQISTAHSPHLEEREDVLTKKIRKIRNSAGHVCAR
jgi:hypothetical protein